MSTSALPEGSISICTNRIVISVVAKASESRTNGVGIRANLSAPRLAAPHVRRLALIPLEAPMTNEPDTDQSTPEDEAEEMENVQEDAAKEREENCGYQ